MLPHFKRLGLATLFILGILVPPACKKQKTEEIKTPTYQLFNGSLNSIQDPAVLTGDGKLLMVANGMSGGMVVIKSSIQGENIFSKEMYFTSNTGQYSIAESGSGKIYVLGTTAKNWSVSKYDLILVKCNSDGDTIWTKVFGSPLQENASLIKKTRDGGLILGAQVLPAGGSGLTDFLFIKLDAEGNEQWQYSHYTNASATISDLVETSDNHFVIVGPTNAGSTYLLKLNSNGNKVLQNTLFSSGFSQMYSIAESSDGGYLCAGSGQGDVVVVKVDKDCKQIWSKTVGYTDHTESGYAMVHNGNGTITIVGSSNGPNTKGQLDIMAMNVSEDGKGIWYKAFGGKNQDIAYYVIKDANNNSVILGNSNSFGQNFSNQIFAVVMDNNGHFK